MPDLPIVIPNTSAAPKDYTLSGGQELQLKTVRALIDGSGAATAFLPTLQLLDPNGHVMWEGATSTTVAAGGSADVSWFPGLGATGSTSTTNAEWFITNRTTNLTMLAGVTDTIPWTTLDSSDSSLFSLTNRHHPNDSVSVSRAGVIMFQVWAEASNLEPNFPMAVALNSDNGVSSATNTPYNQGDTLGLTPAAAATFGPTDVAINIPDAVPFKVYAQATNYDAVNRVMQLSQMWGIWWPIGTLSPF